MADKTPSGVYRSADGNYHLPNGDLIPEKDALEMLAEDGATPIETPTSPSPVPELVVEPKPRRRPA